MSFMIGWRTRVFVVGCTVVWTITNDMTAEFTRSTTELMGSVVKNERVRDADICTVVRSLIAPDGWLD